MSTIIRGKYEVRTTPEQSHETGLHRASYNLYVDNVRVGGSTGRSDWCDTAGEAERLAGELGLEAAEKRIKIDEIKSR